MRKSQPSIGRRLLQAGIATGTVTAVLVAMAPPAFAANLALTLSNYTGPVGGGTVITATATDFVKDVTIANTEVRFNTAVACPAAFGGVTATNVKATATKTSDSVLSITTPALGTTPNTWRICIYGVTTGTISSTAPLIGNVTTSPYRTFIPAAIDPATGPAGGGNTVTLTETNLIGTGTTLGATFVTPASGACPTTYTVGAGSTAVTTLSKTSANVATLTVPTSLAAPATYKACLYNGTTATSALIGVGNDPYAPLYPQATLSSTSGKNGGGNVITATLTGAFGSITAPGVVFSTVACPSTYGTPTAANVASMTKTADVVTITVPSGVVVPGPYNVCIYDGSLSGSVVAAVGSAAYTPTLPTVTVSPTSAKNASGAQITVTATGGLFAGTNPGVVFANALTCPDTYGAPTAGTATTAASKTDDVLTVTVPNAVLFPSSYRICVYNTASASSSLIATGNAQFTPTLPTITLTPDAGPTGGGGTITASSTTEGNFLFGVTTPAATFTKADDCTATYSTTAVTGPFASNGLPTRISNVKAAIKVPASVVYTSADGATSEWQVCLYRSTSGPLIGTAAYRVGPALTVTSIDPPSGPAQGGSPILVTGVGFTQGLTASIGGAPIENIVVANDGLTFTGTTTARSAGTGLAVTVKTDSGTKQGGVYEYSFGITITPNTAPNTRSDLTLDILGAGFESIGTFGTGNAAAPHVYLIRGGIGAATAYDPEETGAASGIKKVGQVQECTSVVVISDLELLCTLDLTDSIDPTTNSLTPTGQEVPEGTYTVTVVSSGIVGNAAAVAGVTQSKITSGSTFTVSEY